MKEVDQELSELNLRYLLLAQRLVRDNLPEAMFRLGVDKELAQILGKLTLTQIIKLAASGTALCNFRFDRPSVLKVMVDTKKSDDLMRTHAAILLAQQPLVTFA